MPESAPKTLASICQVPRGNCLFSSCSCQLAKSCCYLAKSVPTVCPCQDNAKLLLRPQSRAYNTTSNMTRLCLSAACTCSAAMHLHRTPPNWHRVHNQHTDCPGCAALISGSTPMLLYISAGRTAAGDGAAGALQAPASLAHHLPTSPSPSQRFLWLAVLLPKT